jgi:acyl-CoA reductase-like NAD-dependent aldehyde dehydrogenase
MNPATNEEVVKLPLGGGPECAAALRDAREAWPAWAARTGYERAKILTQCAAIIRAEAEQLAPVTVRESGKPLVEARGEWLVAADFFDFFAGEATRTLGEIIPARTRERQTQVTYQPLGVVGIITAWNFPVYNPARAWAAALGAGCAVVAKPAELTPLSALHLAEILERAGLPAGVLSVVFGDAPAIGKTLLETPHCRKVSFTGSVRVGKELMRGAADNVTRLGLELGGNAPVIVCADVDVEAVARGAVQAKFRNNGQVCVAPQRFLVDATIVGDFTRFAVDEARKIRLGDGLDPQTTVGPLISARQREHVERLVADAISHGARLECGGKRPDHLPNGHFYEPTILSGVSADMAIFREEIFGPVMPITAVDSPKAALALANNSEYGLAAYVWTKDVQRAEALSRGLECGLVGVNAWAAHATEAPFQGWKQSGLGTECGREGLLEYMERKTIAYGGLGGPAKL